jgi:hypothetical protein
MRLFEAPFSSNLAPAISVPSKIERRFIIKKVYEKIKILQTALFNAKLYINIYMFFIKILVHYEILSGL